jgi:hypothetical protein
MDVDANMPLNVSQASRGVVAKRTMPMNLSVIDETNATRIVWSSCTHY